jgi:hypothetical protein
MTPSAMTAAGRSAAPRPVQAPAAPGHRRTARPPQAPRGPRRVSGPARARSAAPASAPGYRPSLAARGLLVIRGLPEHTLLDRIVRGRAWIPLLGVLLVGIVAMQVEILKLGTGMGRWIERGSTLSTKNQALQANVAALMDDQRIERLAANMGMVMPDPTAVSFLSAQPGVARAVAGIHAPDPSIFTTESASQAAAATSSADTSSTASALVDTSSAASASTGTGVGAGSPTSSGAGSAAGQTAATSDGSGASAGTGGAAGGAGGPVDGGGTSSTGGGQPSGSGGAASMAPPASQASGSNGG